MRKWIEYLIYFFYKRNDSYFLGLLISLVFLLINLFSICIFLNIDINYILSLSDANEYLNERVMILIILMILYIPFSFFFKKEKITNMMFTL